LQPKKKMKQYKVSRLVRLEYETLANTPKEALEASEKEFQHMMENTDWYENGLAKVGYPTIYIEDSNGDYRETKQF